MNCSGRQNGLHGFDPDFGGVVSHARPLCRPALVIIAVFAAIVLALVPLSLDYDWSYDAEHPAHYGVNRVKVHKSEAHAVTYASAAYDLINIYAAQAALTSGDFVACVVGAGTIGSGMTLTRDFGVKYGDTLEDNLANLINAADYPDWDTLDSETQAFWGDKVNYDAAKFHEFLNAFGFKDTYTRYEGFLEQGGGSFDLNEIETDRLEQIGRIGRTWMDRGGVALSEISDLVTMKNLLYWAIYGEPVYEADGSGLEGWPDQIPRSFRMNYGRVFEYKAPNVVKQYYVISPGDVFGFTFWNGSNAHWTVLWSEYPFLYGSFSNIEDANPTTAAQQNGDVYMMAVHGFHVNGHIEGTLPETICTPWFYGNQPIITALNLLVGARRIPQSNYHPNLEGYPENIQDMPSGQTFVYVPNGVTPDMTWNNFFEQPPYVRPDNPYNPPNPDNPGYQSGTPEWKEETGKNLTPLLNVHLEKLFPFCLVYDLQLLWTKFSGSIYTESGGLRTQAVEDYTRVVIPLRYDAQFINWDIDEDIEIDLNPLKDLLNITKPFMFFLLMFGLISAIVNFWKRILTGA